MTEISGSGPLKPNQIKMYEQEYQHGADLFQRALNQYGKSDNPDQKAEFKSVMDQAMNVMNQTAHGLMRKELEEKNRLIEKDYEDFQSHPDDPNYSQKLNQDLDSAKRSIW